MFWRITLFYILGLFFVGLLVDCNDPNLLSDSPYADANASPFVLVGKYAGLKGFDSFMNVVILVSVLSIGVSAVYGGSRTLTALAQQGYAPKIFTYIDRSGRPLPSVGIIILFGVLAYVSLDASGPVVFDWLLALSGLAALFTWGSVCLAHIRFRKAWKYHGHSLDEIPFQAVGGVYGSYLGLTLVILVLIAQVCSVTSEMCVKSLKTLMFGDSSTLLSRHLQESTAWVQLRVSSSSTWRSPSSYSSGLLAISGSEPVGYERRRSMSTPTDVSMTGMRSMPTAPSWRPTLLGVASSTRFSKHCKNLYLWP